MYLMEPVKEETMQDNSAIHALNFPTGLTKQDLVYFPGYVMPNCYARENVSFFLQVTLNIGLQSQETMCITFKISKHEVLRIFH